MNRSPLGALFGRAGASNPFASAGSAGGAPLSPPPAPREPLRPFSVGNPNINPLQPPPQVEPQAQAAPVLPERGPIPKPRAYANIPDVDEMGRPGQVAKFREWNPDPIGGSDAQLQEVNPQLQQIVKRAQEISDQPFVIGSGKRTPEMQVKAKEWGWSKTSKSDHLTGNAIDLWPLDEKGVVDFSPERQQKVQKAMQRAAKDLGIDLDAGGNWKTADRPHFGVSGSEPSSPSELSSPVAFRHAIGTVESSNRYDAVGPRTKKGQRAYGRYQVMDFNVGPWTQEVLGKRMTPQEFLASPEAQDAVFDAKFGGFFRQYGSFDDAASVWFSGRPMSKAGSASDVTGTTVPSYVKKARAALGKAPSPAQIAQTTGDSPKVSGSVGAESAPPSAMQAFLQRVTEGQQGGRGAPPAQPGEPPPQEPPQDDAGALLAQAQATTQAQQAQRQPKWSMEQLRSMPAGAKIEVIKQLGQKRTV